MFDSTPLRKYQLKMHQSIQLLLLSWSNFLAIINVIKLSVFNLEISSSIYDGVIFYFFIKAFLSDLCNAIALLVFWVHFTWPKTVTENWVSKQSWLFWYWSHFTLGLAHIFFQDRKLKFSASVWKRISWNLTKFELNQLIWTISISIFSIGCLIKVEI